ncbi:MAG: regulatory iron-sulfur-containing complex subunit RicT [Bacteroidota bacterium]|nr:regulatory iron-sulfur-containing complex subunit RicT [Bacteroidota bacterium]
MEVRFKNSRKEFFRYTTDYELNTGDIVAVESSPGHDIGIVSLTGELVKLQMKRKKVDPHSEQIKKVYRKARISDIQKWVQSVKKEEKTKLKTRKIASDLKLEMKINDVEYQGDDTKAIFYYTADERVDFREMIKLLAEQFRVRIEMKQIGARQEASRVGGIGSCGRELCCATWMCDFSSVTTNTARTQQLSLNPQKLAGQCGKLKCCLNYEFSTYLDALKEFPDQNLVLKTKKGNALYQKADVFKKLIWYSYDNERDSDIMAIPLDKVKKIIEMNNHNKMPEKLEEFAATKEQKTNFENAGDTDDLKRFDKLQ